MKVFLASVIFAAIFAVGSAMVLKNNFQVPSYSAFSTEGARVGNPGTNLISF